MFQTASHCAFQLLAQTAHVCFTGKSGYTLGLRRKIAHNGSHAETGGISDGGWYHYPRSVPHVHKHPRAGYQNSALCRFWVLAGGTPEERKEPSGQRCAYARRCSAGVAAPLGCVILLPLLVQPDLLGWKDLTKRSGRVTITRNYRAASRLALVWEPRWAVK